MVTRNQTIKWIPETLISMKSDNEVEPKLSDLKVWKFETFRSESLKVPSLQIWKFEGFKPSDLKVWRFETFRSESLKVSNLQIWKFECFKPSDLKVWKFEGFKPWDATLPTANAAPTSSWRKTNNKVKYRATIFSHAWICPRPGSGLVRINSGLRAKSPGLRRVFPSLRLGLRYGQTTSLLSPSGGCYIQKRVVLLHRRRSLYPSGWQAPLLATLQHPVNQTKSMRL